MELYWYKNIYLYQMTSSNMDFFKIVIQLYVKLTFQHLHCHLHDRLGAAESIGSALHHLPKGSRAQDTTFENHNMGSAINKDKQTEPAQTQGYKHIYALWMPLLSHL